MSKAILFSLSALRWWVISTQVTGSKVLKVFLFLFICFIPLNQSLAMALNWTDELKVAMQEWADRESPGELFQRLKPDAATRIVSLSKSELLAFLIASYDDGRVLVGRDFRILFLALGALGEEEWRQLPRSIVHRFLRGLNYGQMHGVNWPEISAQYYHRLWHIILTDIEERGSVVSDSGIFAKKVLDLKMEPWLSSLKTHTFSQDLLWIYRQIEEKVRRSNEYRPEALAADIWWQIFLFRTRDQTEGKFASEKLAHEILISLEDEAASTALFELRLDLSSRISRSSRLQARIEALLKQDDPHIRLSALWALKNILGSETSWWQLKAFESIRHADRRLTEIYSQKQDENSEQALISEAGVIRTVFRELIQSNIRISNLLSSKIKQTMLNYDLGFSETLWSWLSNSARDGEDPLLLRILLEFSQLPIPKKMAGREEFEFADVYQFSLILGKAIGIYLKKQVSEKEVALGLLRQVADSRVLNSGAVDRDVILGFEDLLIGEGWIQTRISENCDNVVLFVRR